MSQLLTTPLYRSDFSRATGIAFLRETDHEVHLVNWREVSQELRRTLQSVHGKPVVFHPVREHDAVARVATGRGPQAALPTPAAPAPEASPHDAAERDRLRNLSPEDNLLRSILTAAVHAGAS
ncbi:MAG TPA: hypothetical protein VJ932_04650, partial [Alkalispirochaeta sp.]|nr:hypothetical protein [Alkalispirochaeta sp.]